MWPLHLFVCRTWASFTKPVSAHLCASIARTLIRNFLMEQSPPRGGSEDQSDTSEQSSSTNDRSSNATNAPSSTSSNQPRRRGSRGGQGGGKSAADWSSSAKRNPEELPEPMREGRLGSPEAREEALVKKPQIGDTMPVPNVPPPGPANGPSEDAESSPSSNRSGQKRRRKSGGQEGQQQKKHANMKT